MAKAKTEEKSHSPLGASNCERWYACPGSVELISEAPKERPNKYAAEGTVAHRIAEERVKNIKGLDKWVVNATLGSKHKADGFTFEVTEEMLEAVQVYADLIQEIVNEHGMKPEQIMVEQRISIPVDSTYELFGTADCILYLPMYKLIVIDYKHGAGTKVNVDGNKQLLYYGLGAWLSLPEDERDEISTVEMIVVQPRVPGSGDGVSRYEIPVETLLSFHEDLKTAVARVKPGAPLVAGSHCKWCPAKPICPALQEYAVTEAALDFAEIKQLPSNSVPSFPSPLTLTPEQLSKVLMAKSLILEYFTSCESLALSMKENGVDVPGFKRVQAWGNRKWTEGAYSEMAPRLMGTMSDLVYNKPELLSPAKLETAIKEWNKKNKDFQVDSKCIDAYTERPDNGIVLAPQKDKRPDLDEKPGDDFNDI